MMMNILLKKREIVYAYTDAACAENQVTVPVGIENCYDYAAGLYSYKMVCT